MGVKVKERVKGEWWIFINHKGKRKAKKIGKDKRTAMDVAKKIEARLTLGEFDIEEGKKEIPTFKEYSDLWLSSYIKPLRRSSTHERYQEVLKRHVYPVIGEIPLDQIRRANIRDLLLDLHRKGLSRSTVSFMRNVISGPMAYAVDAELIPMNPTTGLIKSLHIEQDKGEHVSPLTPEEVNLFLKTCNEHFREYYPFFLCAFRTGMRLGELLALQWGDVDWNRKFIEVKRSYKLGCLSPTKTGKVRRVDMSDHLIETLQGLLTVRKKEGLQIGLGEAVEGIFYRQGLPMEQNYIRRVFKRILQKAGLRDIRFHDVRHTFASLLLSDGTTPVYVKEQMGHSSIQMTVDIYGHLIPSSNRAAVNRLDTQPDATPAQPVEMKKPQPIEIAGLSK
jgi:integrase